MRFFILSLMVTLSSHAFAGSEITGQWYRPYVDFANGEYSPETLMKIGSGDRVSLEILFPGKMQKQVVVYKSILTPSSRQDVEVLSQTDCGNIYLTDLTPNSMLVRNNRLSIAGSEGFTRPSKSQVRRFSALTEGCN